MRISAQARVAIRTAISDHPRWDDLRAEKGWSLSTMNKEQFLDACDLLNISIDTICATVDSATTDFPADTVSNAAVSFKAVAANAAGTNAHAFVPAVAEPDYAAEAAAAMQTVNMDYVSATDTRPGQVMAATLLPWSDDKLRRFDSVLALVDDTASFSDLYRFAHDAQAAVYQLDARIADLMTSAAPAATVDLATSGTDAFVAPSWARDFEDFLSIGATIAVVGPAGNGKTTGCRKLLEASGFHVYEMDCTDATMPQDIIGRTSLRSENGATVTEWVAGPLAKAFNDPRGALLLNEYDALDPRSAMALQSALEAGHSRRATSPDSGEQLQACGPCPIVLTLNTLGHGATSSYQGRNALDGANRDRVEMIVTGYEHEAAIMVSHGIAPATADRLAEWAGRARYTLGKMNNLEILSCRRLITAGQLMDGRSMSFAEATAKAFINRLGADTAKLFNSTI